MSDDFAGKLLIDRDRLRGIVRDVWAALWYAEPADVELHPDHENNTARIVRAFMDAAHQTNTLLQRERDEWRATSDLMEAKRDQFRIERDELWAERDALKEELEATRVAFNEAVATGDITVAFLNTDTETS